MAATCRRSRSRPLPLLSPAAPAALLVLLAVAGRVAGDESSVENQCSEVVGTKLMDCLKYTQEKEAAPTKKCCQSTADIRAKDPACLCYVIDETYERNDRFTSLGLKLPRLVQLPVACNISNSNITDCPRLLNLAPDGDAYKFFMGNGTGTVGPRSAGSRKQVLRRSAYASAACALVLRVFS